MYPFWHKYPYTDLQELNLDWLLETIKYLQQQYEALGDLTDLPTYVDNYLASVDWSGLVGTQLQAMYDGGQLADLIGQYIADQVTPTLEQLQEDVAGLRNAQGAYERDSSSTAVHDLDFYYIDRTYAGTDSDGTQEKPFTSVDQAVEETFNKGIFSPNMRFLTGGTYTCKYAVFNAVTWHLSGRTASTRPVVHFTAHNNITFYNSHTNFAGFDMIIDDPNYIFRAENSEIHIGYTSTSQTLNAGDGFSCNRRLQLASCGAHIANCVLESIAATNSTFYMEAANQLTVETHNNAFAMQYNCSAQVDGTLTINSSGSTEDTKRAIMCTENSYLFLNTQPTIGAGYTYDLRLSNAHLRTAAATLAGFTAPSYGGLYTLQTAAQTIS